VKSDVSEYLEVVQAVYIDACAKCSADVFALRDLETIKSRVENEGLSFLTITLPQFARDFERSIATGAIDSAHFRNFKKCGAIPAFLQGMLSLIFNQKTGKVTSYDSPSTTNAEGDASSDIPTVVESIRQICRLFTKVELACTPKRVQAALESYTEIEQDLQTFSASDEMARKFSLVSRMLWDNLFRDFNPSTLIPSHGPGATADRVSGNQKYVWRRWHNRLEPYFPIVDSGYPLGIPPNSEELEIVTIVTEDDEQPVRVITVPKTLKSPRIIAIEPACMQYTQQGIRDYLYDSIEGYWLTGGRINFRDQTINQRLALKASRTGRYATIDLSEASDRVSLSLAMEMFKGNQDLHDSILACRSTKAQLPDGTIISPLRKFASMGSALCFPIEAMFFYTICVVALLDSSSLSYSQRNIFKVSRRIYVYGDDIIVPNVNADVVLDYLQKNNCKVNTNKTFLSGSFRESCGVDAYAGTQVTPVYIRRTPPENKRQQQNLISWVATANLFYLKGYWQTASLMFAKCERYLGPLPYVRETSPVLGRYSFLGYESVDRWLNKSNRSSYTSNYQTPEVWGWVPSPVHRSDELDGWSALHKCLTAMAKRDKSRVSQLAVKRDCSEDLTAELISCFSARASLEDVSSVDERHLIRSALHGAVTLKRRWAPAH